MTPSTLPNAFADCREIDPFDRAVPGNVPFAVCPAHRDRLNESERKMFGKGAEDWTEDEIKGMPQSPETKSLAVPVVCQSAPAQVVPVHDGKLWAVAGATFGDFHTMEGKPGELYVPLSFERAVAEQYAKAYNAVAAHRRLPFAETKAVTIEDVVAAVAFDPKAYTTDYGTCVGIWFVDERNQHVGPGDNLMRFAGAADAAPAAAGVVAWEGGAK